MIDDRSTKKENGKRKRCHLFLTETRGTPATGVRIAVVRAHAVGTAVNPALVVVVVAWASNLVPPHTHINIVVLALARLERITPLFPFS